MERTFFQPLVTAVILAISTSMIAVAEEKNVPGKHASVLLIDLSKVVPVAKDNGFAYFEDRFGKPKHSAAGNVEAEDFAEHYGAWRTYKVPVNPSSYIPKSLTVTLGIGSTSRIGSIDYVIVLPDDLSGKQVVKSIEQTLKFKRSTIKDSQELVRPIRETTRGFHLSNDDWNLWIGRQRDNVGSGKVRVKVRISPPLKKRKRNR